mgnify:CR=1 FL=1
MMSLDILNDRKIRNTELNRVTLPLLAFHFCIFTPVNFFSIHYLLQYNKDVFCDLFYLKQNETVI